MTIKNFEANVPAKLLATGRDYFSREKIMDLAEVSPGRWTASIWSNRYYNLSISLEGKNVTLTKCECEGFSPEAYCSHIIAMLFAIQYAKGMINERDAFLGADPGAKGGKAVKESDKAEMARYAKMIREPFNQAKDSTGHIYRDQTNKVLRIPKQLLDEARQAFNEKKIKEAINITLAVVETVYHCSLKLEHGDNSTLDIFYPGFELLAEIVNESPSKEVINRLYEHGISAAAEVKKHIDSYHTFWLELVIKKKLYQGEDNELLEVLNAMIRYAKLDRDTSNEKTLLALKAHYIKDSGKEDVPDTPAPAPEKPAKTIPQLMPGQDQPALVKALQEAKKQGNQKRIEMYQQCILSDRRDRKDTIGVREIALELFKQNPTETYLKFIQETYAQEEWEEVKEGLMQQMNGKKKERN